MKRSQLDTRDLTILSQRAGAYAAQSGPRIGDYVDFADGVTRQISHIWDLLPVPSIQTSDGGSFYLGDGYCSFSGGLHPGIPADTLNLTEETREGQVWFFHHNYTTAHNGIDVVIPFCVYRCTLTSQRRIP
jgi:hypothetical protein